jgi:Ca2+-binding RTX toxin-like protein
MRKFLNNVLGRKTGPDLRSGRLAAGRRTQPVLEQLENRLVPAGSISVSGGWVWVIGTNAADTVSVTVDSRGTMGTSDDQMVVTMCHNDGTTTGPHAHTGRFNLVTRTTAGDLRLNGVAFAGYGGGDYFDNWSGVTAYAWGGAGNDTLLGGWGTDNFFGEDGQDYLDGYDGQDYLDGGRDNYVDVIYGGSEADTIVAEWYWTSKGQLNRDQVNDFNYAAGDRLI